MSWSFAIINNKLAEVYFERTKGEPKFFAHTYVKKEEFKTKKEQRMIQEDTANNQLVYRGGIYKRVNLGNVIDSHSIYIINYPWFLEEWKLLNKKIKDL